MATVRAVIVFITNLAKYTIWGYAVETLAYVLKPIDCIKFSSKLTGTVKMGHSGAI